MRVIHGCDFAKKKKRKAENWVTRNGGGCLKKRYADLVGSWLTG